MERIELIVVVLIIVVIIGTATIAVYGVASGKLKIGLSKNDCVVYKEGVVTDIIADNGLILVWDDGTKMKPNWFNDVDMTGPAMCCWWGDALKCMTQHDWKQETRFNIIRE